MARNRYSFQDGGYVVIGGIRLVNVTEVTVDMSAEREYEDDTVAGDTRTSSHKGLDQEIECTVEVSLYDESGVRGSFSQFRLNAVSGKDRDVTIVSPDGYGNKQITFPAMDLQNKPMEFPTGANRPNARGSMTWYCRMDSEPPWRTVAA